MSGRDELPAGYRVEYGSHRTWQALHHSRVISAWSEKASARAACFAHAGLPLPEAASRPEEQDAAPIAPPPSTGEAKTVKPVAWQCRYRPWAGSANGSARWSIWMAGRPTDFVKTEPADWEERPLYTHPADHEALRAENEQILGVNDGLREIALRETLAKQAAERERDETRAENDRLTNANAALINDTVQMGLARDEAEARAEIAERALADAERRIAAAAEDERDRLYRKANAEHIAAEERGSAFAQDFHSAAASWLGNEGGKSEDDRSFLRAADPSRSSASDGWEVETSNG